MGYVSCILSITEKVIMPETAFTDITVNEAGRENKNISKARIWDRTIHRSQGCVGEHDCPMMLEGGCDTNQAVAQLLKPAGLQMCFSQREACWGPAWVVFWSLEQDAYFPALAVERMLEFLVHGKRQKQWRGWGGKASLSPCHLWENIKLYWKAK